MSGIDRLKVLVPTLDAHARSVAGAAGKVKTARQAGDSAKLGAGAYGLAGAAAAVLLSVLEGTVTNALNSVNDSLLDSEAGLKAAAKLYRAADDQNAGAVEELVVDALRRGRR